MTIALSQVVHQVLVIRLLSVPFFILIAQENLAKHGMAKRGKTGPGHLVIMISVTFA